MTKKKKFIIALAVFAALGSAACASQKMAHHGHHGAQFQKFISYRVDSVLDDIDASESQRAQAHQSKEKMFQRVKTAREGSKETRAIFVEEWKSETPDTQRLHALVDKRVASFAKVAHTFVDEMASLQSSLDTQQREKIAGLMEEHMKHE